MFQPEPILHSNVIQPKSNVYSLMCCPLYFISLDEVSLELVDLAIEDNTECNFDKLVMRFIFEDREQTVCGQNLNDVRFQRIFEGIGPVELIFTSDGSATLSGFRLTYTGNDSIFLVDHMIFIVSSI